MKERICLICGRTYVKVIGVSFAKYCSEECRRKAGKLQGKIRHKLKYKSKRKQYKPIRCIICGSEFIPLQRTSKYCSNRCKRKASAQRQEKHICKYCGRLFLREPRGHDAYKFCSRECSEKYVGIMTANREAAQSLKKLRWEKCETCGKVFVTTKKQQKYCSSSCRYLSEKERMRKRSTMLRPMLFEPKIAKCRYCGKRFTTSYKGNKDFCSEECRQNQVKLHRKNHKHRLKGKIVDKDITLKRVAKQYKNKCALCGRDVDWNDYTYKNGAFVAGDDYPSIDHIIPVSNGGLHEWSNVQLSHRRCNSLKGGSFLVCEVVVEGQIQN